ncbi:hypothetical protein PVAND_007704 [Polypedilum vanderplanki]|uniref:PHD-type domain-containing protein n=1 Tax=Polypedilum vanderplanki TaxID=319348 RepID=A0A9J6C813_POLVA|nr:hypothetical protein PVAND_007704 [Polypedilum vanderplanki]
MPLSSPSLATYLANPTLKKKYIDDNTGADKIKSFVFHYNQLQLDLVCSICEQPECQVEGENRFNFKGTNLNGKDYFIWCISCDRVNHAACLAINDLSDDQAPFICATCAAHPENEFARALTNNNRYSLPLSDRLKTIQSVDVSQVENELLRYFRNLEIEFEFGRPSLSQIKELIETQREETEILLSRLKESRAQNTNLTEALQSKEEELRLLKINVNKPHLQEKEATKERKRFPSVIYASEVDKPAYNSTTHSFGMNSSTTFNQMSSDPAIEAIRKLGLNQLRNVLPIVNDFNGDPAQWLTFERSIKLVQREGAYDNQFMKHIIRDKLKGLAARLVDKLFDTHDWDEIMDHLRKAFGNPQIVVNSARKQVQELSLPKKLTQAALTEASTTISAYLEACRQANIQSHDRSLAWKVYNQLGSRHAEEYYSFFKLNYPHEAREERLDVLIEFFDSIRDVLPIGTYSSFQGNKDTNKPKSFQLNSISNNDQSSQGHSSNANSQQQRGPTRGSPNDKPKPDAYYVKDVKESKHLGYFTDKVKDYPKKCHLCGKNNHYTIECRNYKTKTIDERLKLIQEKQLCSSCVIATDHQARQCQLRKGCGIRSGFKYCNALHHYSLHNKNNAQFPANTNKAESSNSNGASSATDTPSNKYQGYSVTGAQGNNKVIFAEPSQEGFMVLTASANSAMKSSPRTIKLFRTFVSHNGVRATAYTVGDSAAEISLVKRELVDALGITGHPAAVAIQWTDESSKTLTDIKVNLPLRGILPNSKEYILNDCFAVDDFQLPPRSLNVEQLKEHFPYLKSVPFDSYRNAVPAILLGTSHASLIEAIAPIWEDGLGKPIGMLTKLGYTIYGANLEQTENTKVINAITSSLLEASEPTEEPEHITNEELLKQLEFSTSLESLHLKPFGIQQTVDEKSAISQAESGLKQLSSGFIQMPLIWRLRDGKRPHIPDNFPMVLQRQVSSREKTLKNSRATRHSTIILNVKSMMVTLEQLLNKIC